MVGVRLPKHLGGLLALPLERRDSSLLLALCALELYLQCLALVRQHLHVLAVLSTALVLKLACLLPGTPDVNHG